MPSTSAPRAARGRATRGTWNSRRWASRRIPSRGCMAPWGSSRRRGMPARSRCRFSPRYWRWRWSAADDGRPRSPLLHGARSVLADAPREDAVPDRVEFAGRFAPAHRARADGDCNVGERCTGSRAENLIVVELMAAAFQKLAGDVSQEGILKGDVGARNGRDGEGEIDHPLLRFPARH